MGTGIGMPRITIIGTEVYLVVVDVDVVDLRAGRYASMSAS